MKMEMAQNLPNTVDDEWDRSMQHVDIINNIDCINQRVIMINKWNALTKLKRGNHSFRVGAVLVKPIEDYP
jgi:hypothetical protein